MFIFRCFLFDAATRFGGVFDAVIDRLAITGGLTGGKVCSFEVIVISYSYLEWRYIKIGQELDSTKCVNCWQTFIPV